MNQKTLKIILKNTIKLMEAAKAAQWDIFRVLSPDCEHLSTKTCSCKKLVEVEEADRKKFASPYQPEFFVDHDTDCTLGNCPYLKGKCGGLKSAERTFEDLTAPERIKFLAWLLNRRRKKNDTNR